MKLLHCLSSPHVGGIERLVIELAIAQYKDGFDVSIMLDSREGMYYNYLSKQGIVLLDSGIRNGFDLNYITYKNLKNKFKKFDIVHLHSFIPICSAAALHSGTKTVYTIHGLSKGIRKENRIKFLLRESLKKYFLNRVTILVANSEYTLLLAKEHYELTNTKNICILNGIKLPDLVKKENQLDSEFTIGMVSRFTHRKRVDRLVKAYKKYKEKGGAGKLILVGDGAEYKTIDNMVKELNLSDTIDLVGYTTDVEKYYNQFDLCVFPSEKEPFGLVAVEAYLKGKAVLAFTDSGGLKEVIEPLEPQNLVSSVEELCNKLLFWSENRNQLQNNADARKKYAMQNFSIERMAKNYKEVYSQLMDS